MGEEVVVVIVGAGPAGLATSACLNRLSISNIVLEREDCCASLWKKRSYDRLKLHLAKEFCELPYMPFPPNAPKFVPRIGFINYLDEYVSHFGIKPRYHRNVQFASYNENMGKWRIEVENMSNNRCEVYIAEFLVVATGENSKGFIPKVPGLDRFEGKFMHSSEYENGREFEGKNVLVVGCGNSGMEIAYDLSNWGAKASIVVRNPVHVLTKEIVWVGMKMLKFFPRVIVDMVVVALSRLRYGDMTKFGIHRPNVGPFENKAITGRTPTIDVGAMDKISNGQIQVFPSIKNIQGTTIEFENAKISQFDAIIFATGYESTVQNWLKGRELFNEKGFPKQDFPNHWKGNNGIYSAGFSRKGLLGISQDAENIANDIALTHY